MRAEPTRRRVLGIFAATVAWSATARARDDGPVEWRGSALGAEVSITFAGTDRTTAERAIADVLAEVERLETIFSLQRTDSEVSRLGRDGGLDAPSLDLVQVLTTARRVHAATAGRFDPTVQPLWILHRDWYRDDRGRGRPSEADLAAARAKVGLDRLRIATDRIEAESGMRLTLNGIAQGYVTDRASALLRSAGFDRVLVDLGEVRALGPRRADAPWRIGLPDGRTIDVADGAIATSSGAACAFADNGDHHIFDPVSGRPARIWTWLTVAHPSATVADGFSTGLSCLTPSAVERIVAATPDLAVWGRTADGVVAGGGAG